VPALYVLIARTHRVASPAEAPRGAVPLASPVS
jgi:hypothetical protein